METMEPQPQAADAGQTQQQPHTQPRVASVDGTSCDKDRFSSGSGSPEPNAPYANLTALAQAAATLSKQTPTGALRSHWRAFLWCLFFCIGPIMSGYDLVVAVSLIGVPAFRRDFGYPVGPDYVVSAPWQNGWSAASSIGSMFGGVLAGYISDRAGRKVAAMTACLVSILAALIMFLCPPHNMGLFLFGRLVSGGSIIMLLVVCNSYCAEVSPLALRGITTSSINMWLNVGELIGRGVMSIYGTRLDVYSYRIPFAIQWIYPVLMLLILPFAPESPWYLVRKDKAEVAEDTVHRLGSTSVDAKIQVQQIKETIALEEAHSKSSTYAELFRRDNFRRTMITSVIFVLPQIVGVPLVLSYGTYFFELAGFVATKAFDLSIGITALGIFGNFVTFYTVNHLGRRTLFNWGTYGCAVICLLIGFLTIPKTQSARWAVAVFTVLWNFVYQCGVGPIGYVILAEVPSAKLRTKTIGMANVSQALAGLLSGIITPYLINPDEGNLGGYAGFFYGGLTVFASVWVWWFIVETKGRTTDEVDILFERSVPAWRSASYNCYEGHEESGAQPAASQEEREKH